LRKFKFRAWSKEKKKFVGIYEITNDCICDVLVQYGVSGLIWMPCAGILDKNEKEIYEGDVVRTHRFIQVLGDNYGVCEGEEINICVVQYRNEDACFVFVPTKEHAEANYFNPWDFSDEGMEVIGNCYSNPELLSEKLT
jgi:uncharacterized phage protein (TIGR01671 family)